MMMKCKYLLLSILKKIICKFIVFSNEVIGNSMLFAKLFICHYISNKFYYFKSYIFLTIDPI